MIYGLQCWKPINRKKLPCKIRKKSSTRMVLYCSAKNRRKSFRMFLLVLVSINKALIRMVLFKMLNSIPIIHHTSPRYCSFSNSLVLDESLCSNIRAFHFCPHETRKSCPWIIAAWHVRCNHIGAESTIKDFIRRDSTLATFRPQTLLLG